MSIYESTFILIYCVVLLFLIGTVFGSFLNCVAIRIENHEKWWTGRSKCDACGHVLGFFDLIPIFSFLCLKGRCRYCGAKLSLQYFFSEFILGIIFVCYALLYGSLDSTLLEHLGLIAVLYGLSICDFHTYEIPDGFIIFGCVWWILFEVIQGISIKECIIQILCALAVSGSVLLISLIMDKILKKESMGGGDIKLLFVVGLYMSLLTNVLNLVISCIIGLGFIVLSKQDKIPFGPAISIATVISLLYGNLFIAWYVGLLMF